MAQLPKKDNQGQVPGQSSPQSCFPLIPVSRRNLSPKLGTAGERFFVEKVPGLGGVSRSGVWRQAGQPGQVMGARGCCRHLAPHVAFKSDSFIWPTP